MPLGCSNHFWIPLTRYERSTHNSCIDEGLHVSPVFICKIAQNCRILLLFLFLQSLKPPITPTNMDMNIDLDILSSEIDSAATTPGSVALESLNCQITENINPEGEPQSECGSSELSSLDSALFPCTTVHQSQSSSLLSLRADREIPEIFSAKRKGRTSFVWEKQNGQEYLQDRKWQWKCVRCKISQPRTRGCYLPGPYYL